MDDAVFSDKLEKLRGPLTSYACKLTRRNYDDALDLVQTTLMKAYRKRQNYDGSRSLHGWCRSILLNVFLDIKRHTRLDVLHYEDLPATWHDQSLSFEDVIEDRSPAHAVSPALVELLIGLEGVDRDIVIKLAEGYSHVETARLLDMRPTVYQYALKRLRHRNYEKYLTYQDRCVL